MPHLARVPRSLRAATSYRCSCGIHSVGGRFFIRTAVESIVHFRSLLGAARASEPNRNSPFKSSLVLCVNFCVRVCVCVFWPLLSHVNPSSSARQTTTELSWSCPCLFCFSVFHHEKDSKSLEKKRKPRKKKHDEKHGNRVCRTTVITVGYNYRLPRC